MDQNRPVTKKELKALRRMEKMSQAQEGKSSDTTKWIILGLGVLAFVGAFAFIVFSIKQSKNKPVTLSSSGHVKGSASASATLVEFGDFQCPACKSYEPFVRRATADFDGRLKLIFKHFPLTSIHPNAMLAARVSIAADKQGKFWEMHDWLYDEQDAWAGLPAAAAQTKMEEAAKEFGLNVDQFREDINNPETDDQILEHQDEGIAIGVASTPTFFINNKKLESNPQDYEDFKKLIEQEIK